MIGQMLDSGKMLLFELWMKYVQETYESDGLGKQLFAPPQVPPSARVSGLFLVLNCSGVWWELRPRVSCSYKGCSYKGGGGVYQFVHRFLSDKCWGSPFESIGGTSMRPFVDCFGFVLALFWLVLGSFWFVLVSFGSCWIRF